MIACLFDCSWQITNKGQFYINNLEQSLISYHLDCKISNESNVRIIIMVPTVGKDIHCSNFEYPLTNILHA